MKIEDIMARMDQRLVIDETNLARESIETPKIYAEFLRLRATESLTFKKLRSEYKKLLQDKRDYYLGRADPEVYKKSPFDKRVMKSELDVYLEADEDLANLAMKIEIQEEKVLLLDNVLKQVANRGFHIRNAIEFQRMMNGG